MTLFALVYRPTRALDRAEIAARNRAVREWARQVVRTGAVRIVIVLDSDLTLPASITSDWPPVPGGLADVTVVDVREADDALRIAADFPGRRFGTPVDVCPVGPFLLPTP